MVVVTLDWKTLNRQSTTNNAAKGAHERLTIHTVMEQTL